MRDVYVSELLSSIIEAMKHVEHCTHCGQQMARTKSERITPTGGTPPRTPTVRQPKYRSLRAASIAVQRVR